MLASHMESSCPRGSDGRHALPPPARKNLTRSRSDYSGARRDVQAHVVQLERLAAALGDRAHVRARAARSGRRSRWWPRQTVRRYSLGVVGHDRRCGSSQVSTSGSRRSEALARSPRRRRSSTVPSSRRGAARTAPRAPTSAAAPWKRSTLPAPPHWATSCPRAAAPRAGGRTALVVGDPVEDGVREHGVDRLVELERGQVGLEDGGAVAERRARLRDHRRARRPRRSRGRAGSRSSSSRVTRPLPQPASSTVSSPAARAGRAPVSAHRHLRTRDAVVGRARPSRGLARRSQRGRDRPAPLALAPRSASIASSAPSVTPMSSRPLSSRRRISGSISNAERLPAVARPPGLEVHAASPASITRLTSSSASATGSRPILVQLE